MTQSIRSKVSRGTLEKETLLESKTEKVEMTLNTDNAVASGLLIQRLTELYEDPVEASVRETISNALDAVMESYSGDKPTVEITSPSALNPVFTVRDNGVGMSYNDLKDIYSKYGASTKMDNMDQIGAYGLGAKAPLAYGTEFTVTSVNEGQRTTIIVVREELTNYIKIVDSEKTDAPSGTTVSIPVGSNDIDRFTSHIRKYKYNPVDKAEVSLIIDEVETTESDYIEITDDMLIFDGPEGQVHGRLWIAKRPALITNILSNMSEGEVSRSLEYLIGGWKYGNPTTRGRFSSNAGILVELKAGIVAFNSSRDAILLNDRYSRLEELVVDYISSDKFVKGLIQSVNELDDISLFKTIVVTLINSNTRSIYIRDKSIEIETHNSFSINRRYSLSDFVHSETGFRFDDIFTGVPKVEKPTAIIEETKASYRKSVDNYMPSALEIGDNGGLRDSGYQRHTISEAIKKIDEIMVGEQEAHSLELFMLTLSLRIYNNDNNIRVTFVTDIDTSTDKETKKFRKARTGRKTIVRMRNEDKEDNKYASYIIYTSHSKSQIQTMINKADLNSVDLKIYNVAEVLEKVTEFRKKNRSATVSTVNKKIDTNIYQHGKDNLKRIDNSDIVNEFDKNKINVIVLSKRSYVSNDEMRMIKAWYCNENDTKESDVEVYSSIGQHRKIELEVLKDLGELYEHPLTSSAGHSNLYKELLDGRIAGMHTINKYEDNLGSKSLIRFMTSYSGNSPNDTIEQINDRLMRGIETAKLVNFKMPKYDNKALLKLGEIGEERFNSGNGRWYLNYDSRKQLIENLNDTEKSLLKDLSVFISYNDFTLKIKDDNEFETERISHGLLRPLGEQEMKTAFSEENKDSPLHNIIRAQTNAYLEFIKSIIEKLSTAKI